MTDESFIVRSFVAVSTVLNRVLSVPQASRRYQRTRRRRIRWATVKCLRKNRL